METLLGIDNGEIWQGGVILRSALSHQVPPLSLQKCGFMAVQNHHIS